MFEPTQHCTTVATQLNTFKMTSTVFCQCPVCPSAPNNCTKVINQEKTLTSKIWGQLHNCSFTLIAKAWFLSSYKVICEQKALKVTSKFKYHEWKQNWKSMRRNSTTYYDGYWHILSPQLHVWDMQHLQLVNMLAETPLDPPIPIACTAAATHHRTQPQSRQHCLCQCKILQRLVLARFVSFLPYQVPTQFN